MSNGELRLAVVRQWLLTPCGPPDTASIRRHLNNPDDPGEWELWAAELQAKDCTMQDASTYGKNAEHLDRLTARLGTAQAEMLGAIDEVNVIDSTLAKNLMRILEGRGQ